MSFDVIFPSVVSSIAIVCVAWIETHCQKDRKKMEERAEQRKRESHLAMDMMSATCELSVATAKAIRDGHTNGIMAESLEHAEQAQERYTEFLREVTADVVSGG